MTVTALDAVCTGLVGRGKNSTPDPRKAARETTGRVFDQFLKKFLKFFVHSKLV